MTSAMGALREHIQCRSVQYALDVHHLDGLLSQDALANHRRQPNAVHSGRTAVRLTERAA